LCPARLLDQRRAADVPRHAAAVIRFAARLPSSHSDPVCGSQKGPARRPPPRAQPHLRTDPRPPAPVPRFTGGRRRGARSIAAGSTPTLFPGFSPRPRHPGQGRAPQAARLESPQGAPRRGSAPRTAAPSPPGSLLTARASSSEQRLVRLRRDPQRTGASGKRHPSPQHRHARLGNRPGPAGAPSQQHPPPPAGDVQPPSPQLQGDRHAGG
jgi:hypothetical protein